MIDLTINRDQFFELQKIGIGAFDPLTGFMGEEEFRSVVDHLHLPNGDLFPLPVTLDVSKAQADLIRGSDEIGLVFESYKVGVLRPSSVFEWDKIDAAAKVFGMTDQSHPGVAHMTKMQPILIGGPIQLTAHGKKFLFKAELTPSETKATFARRGWRTIAGFQTRNVPHRAHEYLQRIALEVCDGLFIQPLVGRKKKGDYTPEAIMQGYQALIQGFLPQRYVMLGALSTAMRYAGPREAIFHAIIRRNYGCTHFIVGRDHAGVGTYYEKYEAQKLALKYEKELGIEILALHGPFHCSICDGIVTEKTCPHVDLVQAATTEISGTLMRSIFRQKKVPDPRFMRDEVVNALAGVTVFVDEDDR